ncbi:TonB-dependent receptor [Asticcacaulis endophyticus]|uniref:TonB-dependent receptor n=2 Tax=Asticcacaulis endophyticus TaxID=1395890 RepID=A0A918QG09_9CAUL|nr:TonB-dependent receptor [Asticcacaulis endophyticus]GGZ42334.1 TonB-dependent receptor [Asticcacaulis endophyticus]
MRTMTSYRGGKFFNKVLLTGTSLALLGTALPALAQNDAPPADEPEEILEIVVTAQKREQSLQDVPIVVTTLSAKLLQDAGVRDIKDMQVLTPGLTVTSTQNESLTTARIRGVGTVGDNPGMESSVGVVIDGVYRPRNGVGFGDLGELERIEVLKGPQGTLFGKNTSAGVINIISKKPSSVFGAEAEATVGNYDARGFSAAVTGPIAGEEVLGRLYVAKRERGGYYDVVTGDGPRTTTEDATQDFQTVRGQLLFVPNDDLSIRVIGDWSSREERCCVTVQTRTGPTGALINAITTGGQGIDLTASPEDMTAYANRDTRQFIDDKGVSIEANLKLDFLDSTLTSVTGIRNWKNVNGQDIDYTGADILYRRDNGDFSAEFKTFSQELRLAGSTDKLNWLIGAFYAEEDLDRMDSYVYGTKYAAYISALLSQQIPGTTPSNVLPLLTGRAAGTNFVAGQGALDHYTQSAKSFALFTNNSYQVTEALELTLGLRYTAETKEMTGVYTNSDSGATCGAAIARSGLGGGTPTGIWALIPTASRPTVLGGLCAFWANPAFNNRQVADEQEEKEWSGTFKGAYRWNDNIMTYASYARGYKGGGFNLDRALTGLTPNSSLYFPAETVDSYELGVKTSLFDKKVLFNLTAFDQTFNDFQLNTFLGTAFVVESIPELTSKGWDADIYWATPIRGLSFQGGIAYADTKYAEFVAADLNNPGSFAQLSLLPGAQMSFAPKWTSSGSVTYTRNVAGLRWLANLSAKHTSSYNTGSDLIPFKMQESFTLLNGRIGIGSEDSRWMVEIWGQNLTDESYKQVVINAPLQGTGFQSTVQPDGTFYNRGLDSNTYDAFMGAPKTYGITLRVKY